VFLQRTVLPLPVLFLFSIIQTFLLSVLLLVQYQSMILRFQTCVLWHIGLSDVYVMFFYTFTNVFFYTLNSSSKSLILFSPVL